MQNKFIRLASKSAMSSEINRLGYIVTQPDSDLRPQQYTTAERLGLQVAPGAIVHDKTNAVNYYWNGSVWNDTTMSPVELKLLTSTEVMQLTNIGNVIISATQWGYVGSQDQPTYTTSVPSFQGLQLEETGAGFDKITIEAPAVIAVPYTLTLPVDDGGVNNALVTDGSGVLSWQQQSHTGLADLDGGIYGDGGHSNLVQRSIQAVAPTVLADAAHFYRQGCLWVDTATNGVYVNTQNTNGAAVWSNFVSSVSQVNKQKTYEATFVLLSAVGQPPTLKIEFAEAAFSARIKLLSCDPVDDKKVAVLTVECVGGKWTAGAGNAIAVGNVTTIGHLDAMFSTVVASDATTITLTKTANLVLPDNYDCQLFVELLNGTLVKATDMQTAAVVKTWTY